MEKIKFRQPILGAKGEFNGFHYWGFIDGEFISPYSMREDSQQFICTIKEMDIYDGDCVLVRGRKRIGDYKTTIVRKKQSFTFAENNTYLNDDACFTVILEIIGNVHLHGDLFGLIPANLAIEKTL